MYLIRVYAAYEKSNQEETKQMGKIKINGDASRDVECDFMKVVMRFECIGKNNKEVQEQVLKECESFLEIIRGLGLDTSLLDDSLEEITLRENVRGYKEIKTILIQGKYDATLINVIHEICIKKGFTVTIDVNMCVSNEREKEVRKELLEEALKKSKEAALQIMKAEGKKKMELVSVNKYDRSSLFCRDCGSVPEEIYGTPFYEETLAAVKSNYGNSNELAPKTENIREDLTAIWKISV